MPTPTTHLAALCGADPARAARGAALVSEVRILAIRADPLRARAELPASGGGTYTVTAAVTGTTSCTCPDRAGPCKHSLAVLIRLDEMQAAEEERRRREGWRAGRAA